MPSEEHGRQVFRLRLEEGAIVLEQVRSIDELPASWLDELDASRNRLVTESDFGRILLGL
jgi:hypothetical protein